ncbi:DUF5681 domain-containing protein [Sphingosinicella microcystinivorans]|uniref:DUF5681 domain-containing protein n=1 Tax=Sphingosinicella microcystinivorans TaxID=335406 RepID=UPI0022F3F0D7|nr:DUF5681 domain-containing protein [Sphingosinicella microcystinivorans]WBX86205.1 DUF5681 domain-containing protein [Sphingosinicella microcystinivorans]
MSEEDKEDLPEFEVGDETEGPRRPKRQKLPPSPFYKGDNTGGYGNPPVRTQFKPGGKGGPGRPRGRHSLEAALQKVLREPVAVKTPDGRKAMSYAEALTRRVAERALRPDAPIGMVEFAFELLQKHGPKDEENQPRPDAVGKLSFDEIKLLLQLLARSSDGPQRPKNAALWGLYNVDNIVGDYRAYKREDGLLGLERIDMKTITVKRDDDANSGE